MIATHYKTFSPLYCCICKEEIKVGNKYERSKPGYGRCLTCPKGTRKTNYITAATHQKLTNNFFCQQCFECIDKRERGIISDI